MNRESARNLIKSYLLDYVRTITKKGRNNSGSNMFICPLCGSGTGVNETGAFSVYTESGEGTNEHWHCFRCDKSGDIFDLYGALEGRNNYNEQLAGLCDKYGITIDNTETAFIPDKTSTEAPQLETDYTAFFLKAHEQINKCDYWRKRGLSEETVNRFFLGYIADWKHPKAPECVSTSPRLIIPTSNTSYLARDTRDNINVPEKEKPFIKSKVGTVHIFNAQALNTATKPIFIVEGELDALSIIEVGGEAIALGTTSKKNALVELCKSTPPCQPLIIALDNDNAGNEAAQELSEQLQNAGVKCRRYNPCGTYKDPNEALQRDRNALKAAVDEVNEEQKAEKQALKEKYMLNATSNYIKDFISGISASAATRAIPTSFMGLDRELDGGLYEGLYIIGAISSLGKTTFVMQIADQIAQAGQDVLIFSLEMARTEIMAKSISRHTQINILSQRGDLKIAKTARGITAGARYANYSKQEKECIAEAIRVYQEYAKHLYIVEGVGNIGAEQVRQTVERHVSFTGNVPVVVIDYLQILSPYDVRATDKQNVDKSVLELKRISRDFKTPVIGISSLNRAGYRDIVSMESFKESGAVEYGSDVLIGLQLNGVGKQNFDVNQAKQKDPREIELVILKNRNGKTGGKILFDYFPMFNNFLEK